jgi:hypothetical protein
MDSELVVISQLFPQAPYLEDFPRLAVLKPSERLCWLAYQWLDLRFALFLLTIMKESLQQSANTLVTKTKLNCEHTRKTSLTKLFSMTHLGATEDYSLSIYKETTTHGI